MVWNETEKKRRQLLGQLYIILFIFCYYDDLIYIQLKVAGQQGDSFTAMKSYWNKQRILEILWELKVIRIISQSVQKISIVESLSVTSAGLWVEFEK